MKRNSGFMLAGLALLADSAHAAKSMAEREEAQTIVVTVEIAAFTTIVAVLGYVWHISIRASNKRKAEQEAD